LAGCEFTAQPFPFQTPLALIGLSKQGADEIDGNHF
jgi:hypothetical protein